MSVRVINSDCLTALPQLAAGSVHAIVTDPPAGISFMGKDWDSDKGGRDHWIAWMQEIAAECLRVCKPGGHALVWALPRTSHWTATAWENAGWVVRDRVAHLFGSGFPKSLDVSKQLDSQERNAWLKVAKAIDNLAVSDIIGAWITHSNIAKPATIAFRKNPTEAGIATAESGSAPENVLLSANPANSLASAIIAELASSAARHTPVAISVFAQSSAAAITTASSVPAIIAAGQSGSHGVTQDTAGSFVPWPVLASLAASTSHMEVAAEALRIWLGNERSSKPETTAALCAALTDALKRIILSQSATFLNSDTKSQMDCVSAISATITVSTAESLISYTADTLRRKAIDRAAGAERDVIGPGRWNCVKGSAGKSGGLTQEGFVSHGGTQHQETAPATPEAAAWSGWGTALKPACEDWWLLRKPLEKGLSVAANTLKHGCGGLNIDASRVGIDEIERNIIDTRSGAGFGTIQCEHAGREPGQVFKSHAAGRWPANVLHDGSPEVEEAFARFGESKSSAHTRHNTNKGHDGWDTGTIRSGALDSSHADTGSASRFFFCAKADAADRAGSRHPTVKPLSLMSWLVRLVTPPGGIVLDPFAGTGSTGLAADHLGMNAVLIERDPVYAADAKRKIEQGAGLFASVQTESRLSVSPLPQSDLFSEVA